MSHQCLAAPKTSIKRCRNKSKGESPYCGIHGKLDKKGFSRVRHYDGSVFQYENGNLSSGRMVGKPIAYWIDMNKRLSSKKKVLKKAMKERLVRRAKLLRTGTVTAVTEAFLDEKLFDSQDAVQKFFQPSLPMHLQLRNRNADRDWVAENLDNARKFLGVCFTALNNLHRIIRLQAIIRGALDRKRTGINPQLIRTRVNYQSSLKSVVRIQRWWRHWHWLKNLPVSPQEMRERYIPNLKKIELIKRKMREYVKHKVRHSHGCPYSGEEYWDIPHEKRIVYKYHEGKNTHWRYYDILWLHEDFLHQTSQKRFVVEPATKKEFPDEFVVEVARAAWNITRKKTSLPAR